MSRIIAKKGATTTLNCTRKDAAGDPESVASTAITAVLRNDKLKTIANLTVTKQGSTGVFSIQIGPDDINAVSPSTYWMYIKYDYGSAVDILDPIQVDVIATGE